MAFKRGTRLKIKLGQEDDGGEGRQTQENPGNGWGHNAGRDEAEILARYLRWATSILTLLTGPWAMGQRQDKGVVNCLGIINQLF
jgi:hypothetical protein